MLQSGSTADEQANKGQVLVCAGKLAASVGKETFPQALLAEFITFAKQCLKEDSNKYELRETAMTFFYELTDLLGEEIAPHYEEVVTEILKTCNKKDDFAKQEKTDKNGPDAAKNFSLDSDSEDIDGLLNMEVDLACLDEKSAAVNALGYMFFAAPETSKAALPQINAALENLQFYFHENVKYHVVQAYIQISKGLVKSAGGMTDDNVFPWTRGPASGSPLPADVAQYLDQVVLPYYFKLLDEEEEKEVIERTLEALRELADWFGPAAFANSLPQVVKYVKLLLEKKAHCQTGVKDGEDGEDLEDIEGEEDDDDEEEEEEDDGIDHDELILGNTTDLMLWTARAMGNEFLPVFTELAPALYEYTTDKHPKSDRHMAIGCIGDIFSSCPAAIPACFEAFVKLIDANSHLQDSKMNRNLAYGVGVLAQHAQMLFQPHVPNFLTLLTRLNDNSSEQAAKDNVLAAMCKIVQYQYMPLPPANRPADYQNNINNILMSLPLTGDNSENETILKLAFEL